LGVNFNPSIHPPFEKKENPRLSKKGNASRPFSKHDVPCPLNFTLIVKLIDKEGRKFLLAIESETALAWVFHFVSPIYLCAHSKLTFPFTNIGILVR